MDEALSHGSAFLMECTMEFHRLSADFYSQYGHLEEILNKDKRPYYVLLLQLDGLTYAIPLRSRITHSFCFIADNFSGLDFSKAVVIADTARYIDPLYVKISQHEYNFYKQHEALISKRFSSFVASYKKEVRRCQKNPSIPVSPLCRYASLKHFHNELGLSAK